MRYSSVSPEEFIGAFARAEAVVTNSFHGVAFSLIFKKDFYAECSNKEKASRINDLLSLFRLEDRLLPENPSGSIDWDNVDSILKAEKDRSLLWLKNVLL